MSLSADDIFAALSTDAQDVARQHASMKRAFENELDARKRLVGALAAAVHPAFEVISERRVALQTSPSEEGSPSAACLIRLPSHRGRPLHFSCVQTPDGGVGCIFVEEHAKDVYVALEGEDRDKVLRRISIPELAGQLAELLHKAAHGRMRKRRAEAEALARKFSAVATLLSS